MKGADDDVPNPKDQRAVVALTGVVVCHYHFYESRSNHDEDGGCVLSLLGKSYSGTKIPPPPPPPKWMSCEVPFSLSVGFPVPRGGEPRSGPRGFVSAHSVLFSSVPKGRLPDTAVLSMTYHRTGSSLSPSLFRYDHDEGAP